eukprot:TRINITY_DN3470_c0_g1_i1.p1 TRINITY_DN3470_c0_g1~~TRINITY_DN3470_c0_g1_i1.p1  ORF type:complete len:611 (+),score=83.32 TRINITY_DN3470_c0_g1_i1:177-2009(+)
MFFVLCIALAMSCIQPSTGADVDVLLALRTSANVPFPSWHSTNTSTYCQWHGIACDSNGRVTELDVTGNSTSRPLRGTLPPTITELTELQILVLANNDIVGDFPTAFFLSPKIIRIDLVTTGFTVTLPPVLSPSLTYLSLSDVNVNGTMAEMNWPEVLILDLSATYVTCPLPQGLVNFSRAGGRMKGCYWFSAFLTLDENNMICGQIPLGNFSCDLGPAAVVAPYIAQNVRPANVDYRVEFEQMTLEFVKDEVFFFAAYNRSDGTRNEFRGEYISMKSRPMSQKYITPLTEKNIYTFNQTKFDTFFWERPNRLRVNMTKVENLQFEFVFDFNSSRVSGGHVSIKFSFIVYNLGYTWKSPDPDINVPIFNINLLLNYKLQHSPETGPPVECPKGGLVYKQCQSDVASLFTAFDLNSGEQIVGGKTRRTEMNLAYPADGVIDGRILGGAADNMIIHASRLPWPLPSAEWLEAYNVNNRTAPFSFLKATEQSLVIPLQLKVPRVIDRLDYDPDVSITLLFDPEATAPSEIPVAEIQVGLIVGVVFAAIVIVAVGITVFAKVIFPYMQKRLEKKGSVELDETASDSPSIGANKQGAEPRSTWTRSTLPPGDSIS